MRTVRAIHRRTGDIVSPFSAIEIKPETRKTFAALYDYTCLNPACGARFHWREAVRQRGNTNYLDPTFVLNRGAAHIAGCRYAFTRSAHRADPDYIDDGTLHIRLNFQIGGGEHDVSPNINDYSFLFDQSAGARVRKIPIDGLRLLTDYLEDTFGNLEKIPDDKVDFIYQGVKRHWSELFIASDRYETLYQRTFAKAHGEETDPCFVVVKPVSETRANDKGRPRFMGEAQDVRIGKERLIIRPVIVCENEEMGRHLRSVIKQGDTLLVATRPHPARQYYKTNGEVMIYLAARQTTQLARIDTQTYWRLVSSPRHQQSFLPRLSATPS